VAQRLSDVSLAELVPETKAWNEGRGIDLLSWIGCVGSFEHAIGYAQIFWPELVEHDGCVFLASRFGETSYAGFMQQTHGDRRAVERVMNHQHVLDLFEGSEREPTRAQVIYLGRILREIWSSKLARELPDKRFVVTFYEASEDDLLDAEVTFCQVE
jgi:hypothetical protein